MTFLSTRIYGTYPDCMITFCSLIIKITSCSPNVNIKNLPVCPYMPQRRLIRRLCGIFPMRKNFTLHRSVQSSRDAFHLLARDSCVTLVTYFLCERISHCISLCIKRTADHPPFFLKTRYIDTRTPIRPLCGIPNL